MSPNIQKSSSTMLLEASLFSLSISVVRISVGGRVCCWWAFILFFLILSPSMKITN
jgi:hypothetical protein